MRRFPISWDKTLTSLGFRRNVKRVKQSRYGRQSSRLEQLEVRAMLSAEPITPVRAEYVIVQGEGVEELASSSFNLTTEYGEDDAPQAVLEFNGDPTQNIVYEVTLELRLDDLVLETQEISVNLTRSEFESAFREDRIRTVSEQVRPATIEEIQGWLADLTVNGDFLSVEAASNLTSDGDRLAETASRLAAMADYHLVFNSLLQDDSDKTKYYAAVQRVTSGLLSIDDAALLEAVRVDLGRIALLHGAQLAEDLNNGGELASSALVVRDALLSTVTAYYTVLGVYEVDTDLTRTTDHTAVERAVAVVEDGVFVLGDSLRVEIDGYKAFVGATITPGGQAVASQLQALTSLNPTEIDDGHYVVADSSLVVDSETLELDTDLSGVPTSIGHINADLYYHADQIPTTAKLTVTPVDLGQVDPGSLELSLHWDAWALTYNRYSTDPWTTDVQDRLTPSVTAQQNGDNLEFDVTEAVQRSLLFGDTNADGGVFHSYVTDGDHRQLALDVEATYLAIRDWDTYSERYANRSTIDDHLLYRTDANWDGEVSPEDGQLVLRRLGVAAADFNLDGEVGVADLAIYQKHYGQVVHQFSEGDADFNGIVNAADHTIWEDWDSWFANGVTYRPAEPHFELTLSAAGSLELHSSESTTADTQPSLSLDYPATDLQIELHALESLNDTNNPGRVSGDVVLEYMAPFGAVNDATAALYRIAAGSQIWQPLVTGISLNTVAAGGTDSYTFNSADLSTLEAGDRLLAAIESPSFGVRTTELDLGLVLGGNTLYVFGTDGVDQIEVRDDRVDVRYAFSGSGPFRSFEFGAIQESVGITARGGDDLINVHAGFDGAISFDGGQGDDEYWFDTASADDRTLHFNDTQGLNYWRIEATAYWGQPNVFGLNDFDVTSRTNQTVNLQQYDASGLESMGNYTVSFGNDRAVTLLGAENSATNDSDLQLGRLGLDTYTVDVLTDIDDDRYGEGELSIREALRLANVTQLLPTNKVAIKFDETLFASADQTITLTDGASRSDEITRTQLRLSKSIVIDGPDDKQLTLSGAGETRVLKIDSNVSANLRDITIADGYVDKTAEGGGLYVSSGGALLLDRTVWENNQTTGHTNWQGGRGGAIYVKNTDVQIVESTFELNDARSGGGIYFQPDNGAELLIQKSTFAHNTSSRRSSQGGTGSAITVYSFASTAGSVRVENTTVSNNTADSTAAVYLQGHGGSSSLDVAIVNSTIAYNNAIAPYNGGAGLNDNTSGVTVLDNTIVTNNIQDINGSPNELNLWVDEIEGSHNLIGRTPSWIGLDNWLTTLNGNQILTAGQSAGLLDLGKYGGLTQTHALGPDSPAIGKGDYALGGEADQRGLPRIIGDAADIGAFESTIQRGFDGEGVDSLFVLGTDDDDEIVVSPTTIYSLGIHRYSVPFDSMGLRVHVLGRNGDDTISLLPGIADIYVHGEGGDDLLVGSTGSETLSGGDGDDRLSGGAGDDRLLGEAGNDKLLGQEGEDELIGGSGSNVLTGGDGSDWYRFSEDDLAFGSKSDQIVELPGDTGDDLLDFSSLGASDGIRLDLGDADRQLVYTGYELTLSDEEAIEGVVGTPYDDDIVGNTLANILVGGDGADQLDPVTGVGNYLEGGDGFDAPEFLSNGQSGFRVTGIGWSAQQGVGFNGSQLTSSSGTGANHAEWAFTGLGVGTYEVWAVWSEDGTHATDAPFSIYDGDALPGNLLETMGVNQQQTPADETVAGHGWKQLGGTYAITGDTLTVRLTDDADGVVAANGIRLVQSNEAPALDLIGAQSGSLTTLTTFTATVTDPNLPSPIPVGQLKFRLDPGAPSGAHIHEDTGVFEWTPVGDQTGVFTMVVRVTDLGGLDDYQIVTIAVDAVNQAPTISSVVHNGVPHTPSPGVDLQDVDELVELVFTVNATDPDGLPADLTYSIGEGSPAGVTINGSGVVRWTPTETQNGAYTITVNVVDDGNPPRMAQVAVDVTVLDLSAAPTISPLQLLNNTGAPTDATTADPTVYGVVADDGPLTNVQIRVEYSDDGTNFETQDYAVASDGSFAFTPPRLSSGSTVSIRAKAIETGSGVPDGMETLDGAWSNGSGYFEFTLDQTDLAAPSIDNFHLIYDQGADADTDDKADVAHPTVAGQVSDTSGATRHRVEFYVNGSSTADGWTYTDDNGEFRYTPSGVTPGQDRSIEATVTVDSYFGALANDVQAVIDFDLLTLTPEITAAGIRLLRDTGDDSGNGVTADPSIYGHVEAGGQPASDVRVDVFEASDPDTLVGTVQTDETGRFDFTPLGLLGGQTVTLRAQVVAWEPVTKSWLAGALNDISITLDESANAAPTLVAGSLQLVNEATPAVPPEPAHAFDPTIKGVVQDDGSPQGLVVEFSHDGMFNTVDGYALTDENGEFEYTPIGFGVSTHTIAARVVEWETHQGVRLESNVESLTFALDALNVGAITFSELGLLYDMGDEGDYDVTRDPTIAGVVDFAGDLRDAYVEFDLDGDKRFDQRAQVGEDGSFVITPDGLPEGPVDLRVRIVVPSYDILLPAFSPTSIDTAWYEGPEAAGFEVPLDENGDPIATWEGDFEDDWHNQDFERNWTGGPFTDIMTDWTTLKIKLDPNAGTLLSVSGLAQAASTPTMDSTLSGQVNGDGGLAGLVVEFEHNGSGLIDGTAVTDTNGSFTYVPTGVGPGGTHTVEARVRQSDYLSGTYVLSSPSSAPVAVDADTALPTVLLDLANWHDKWLGEAIDPTLSGSLLYAGNTTELSVEIDLGADGTIDATVLVSGDGDFSVTPEGLSLGSATARARAVRQTADLAFPTYGEWSDTLAWTVLDNATPEVTEFRLRYDTGSGGLQDSVDLLTSDPTVIGAVADDLSPAGLVVEFDHDGDGQADGQVTTDEIGRFEYTPEGMHFGGWEIRARAREWDPADSQENVGDWQDAQVAFVLRDNTAAGAITLSLRQDTVTGTTGTDDDGHTHDPTFVGTVQDVDTPANVTIEFYADLDGQSGLELLGSTTPNEQGDFSFLASGLKFDALTQVEARAYEVDFVTGQLEPGSAIATAEIDLESSHRIDEPVLTGPVAVVGPVADPTVTVSLEGTQAGILDYEILWVEFDHDGDGLPDGVAPFEGSLVFEYTPEGLIPDSNEPVFVKARTLAWELGNPLGGTVEPYLAYSRWSDAAVFTYDPLAPVLEPNSWDLLNNLDETGTEKRSFDPVITGQVTSERDAPVTIEFDYEGDGVADAEVFADERGEFAFATSGLDAGTVSVWARTSQFVTELGESIYGEWLELEFINQALAGPVVSGLELENDTGAVPLSTTDPTVTATLTLPAGGDELAGLKVEVDHNGDGVVDGTATTDDSGKFTYTPLGLAFGAATLRVRGVDGFSTNQILYGEWTPLNFTLEVLAAPTVAMSLLNPPSGGAPVVDPTLQGTVADHDGFSFVVVHFDYDGDDLADAMTTIDQDGNFLFTPSDLPTGSVMLRAKAVAQSGGATVQSDQWFSMTSFDHQPLPAPVVAELYVADFTSGEVRGRVTVDGTGAATQVEFDHEGDFASVEGYVTTDSQGYFSYRPSGLEAGQVTVAVRAVLTGVSGAGSDIVGDPRGISFAYAPPAHVAPSTLEFRLHNDTGAVAGETGDPTLSGSVTPAVPGTIIQWDIATGSQTLDGVVEPGDEVEIAEDGSFLFTPTSLPQGDFTVAALYKVWNPHNGVYEPGEWSPPQTFTLNDDANSPGSVSLAVVEQNGTLGGHPTTGVPLLSGVVTNDGAVSGVKVEFDLNSDGAADGHAVTRADGSFSYYISDLTPNADPVIVYARTRETKYLSEQEILGDWTPFTFVLTESPLVAQLSLDNGLSEGETTTDATISGQAEYDGAYQDLHVELRVSAGNLAPFSEPVDQLQIVTVNATDGTFSYTPTGLLPGPATAWARAVYADGSTGAETKGAWQSVSFTYAVAPTAAPDVRSFGLYDDTGAADGETSNPTLIGSLQTEITFNAGNLHSFDPQDQDLAPVVDILDEGRTLHLAGDAWKAIDLDYEVQADTILAFDFKGSSEQGEIHGIAFDDDLDWNTTSGRNGFELWGSDNPSSFYSGSLYSPYDGHEPGWVHYEIPVGQLFTGTREYLVFANSAAGADGESLFSNVRLYEPASVLASVEIELEWDGSNAEPEQITTVTTDAYGRFTYTPTGLPPQAVKAQARSVVTNPDTSVTYESDWFGLETSQNELKLTANQAATLGVALTLVQTTSTTPLKTDDPTVQGQLLDDGRVAGRLIEFDHNGDGAPDGTTYTNSDGSFTYKPTGLSAGPSKTITARIPEWNYAANSGEGAYVEGTWGWGVTFELEVDVPGEPEIDPDLADAIAPSRNADAALSDAVLSTLGQSGIGMSDGVIDVGFGAYQPLFTNNNRIGEGEQLAERDGSPFTLSSSGLPSNALVDLDDITYSEDTSSDEAGRKLDTTYSWFYDVDVTPGSGGGVITVTIEYEVSYDLVKDQLITETQGFDSLFRTVHIEQHGDYSFSFEALINYTEDGGAITYTDGSYTVVESSDYQYDRTDTSTYTRLSLFETGLESTTDHSDGRYYHHYSEAAAFGGTPLFDPEFPVSGQGPSFSNWTDHPDLTDPGYEDPASLPTPDSLSSRAGASQHSFVYAIGRNVNSHVSGGGDSRIVDAALGNTETDSYSHYSDATYSSDLTGVGAYATDSGDYWLSGVEVFSSNGSMSAGEANSGTYTSTDSTGSSSGTASGSASANYSVTQGTVITYALENASGTAEGSLGLSFTQIESSVDKASSSGSGSFITDYDQGNTEYEGDGTYSYSLGNNANSSMTAVGGGTATLSTDVYTSEPVVNTVMSMSFVVRQSSGATSISKDSGAFSQTTADESTSGNFQSYSDGDFSSSFLNMGSVTALNDQFHATGIIKTGDSGGGTAIISSSGNSEATSDNEVTDSDWSVAQWQTSNQSSGRDFIYTATNDSYSAVGTHDSSQDSTAKYSSQSSGSLVDDIVLTHSYKNNEKTVYTSSNSDNGSFSIVDGVEDSSGNYTFDQSTDRRATRFIRDLQPENPVSSSKRLIRSTSQDVIDESGTYVIEAGVTTETRGDYKNTTRRTTDSQIDTSGDRTNETGDIDISQDPNGIYNHLVFERTQVASSQFDSSDTGSFLQNASGRSSSGDYTENQNTFDVIIYDGSETNRSEKSPDGPGETLDESRRTVTLTSQLTASIGSSSEQSSYAIVNGVRTSAGDLKRDNDNRFLEETNSFTTVDSKRISGTPSATTESLSSVGFVTSRLDNTEKSGYAGSFVLDAEGIYEEGDKSSSSRRRALTDGFSFTKQVFPKKTAGNSVTTSTQDTTETTTQVYDRFDVRTYNEEGRHTNSPEGRTIDADFSSHDHRYDHTQTWVVTDAFFSSDTQKSGIDSSTYRLTDQTTHTDSLVVADEHQMAGKYRLLLGGHATRKGDYIVTRDADTETIVASEVFTAKRTTEVGVKGDLPGEAERNIAGGSTFDRTTYETIVDTVLSETTESSDLLNDGSFRSDSGDEWRWGDLDETQHRVVDGDTKRIAISRMDWSAGSASGSEVQFLDAIFEEDATTHREMNGDLTLHNGKEVDKSGDQTEKFDSTETSTTNVIARHKWKDGKGRSQTDNTTTLSTETKTTDNDVHTSVSMDGSQVKHSPTKIDNTQKESRDWTTIESGTFHDSSYEDPHDNVFDSEEGIKGTRGAREIGSSSNTATSKSDDGKSGKQKVDRSSESERTGWEKAKGFSETDWWPDEELPTGHTEGFAGYVLDLYKTTKTLYSSGHTFHLEDDDLDNARAAGGKYENKGDVTDRETINSYSGVSGTVYEDPDFPGVPKAVFDRSDAYVTVEETIIDHDESGDYSGELLLGGGYEQMSGKATTTTTTSDDFTSKLNKEHDLWDLDGSDYYHTQHSISTWSSATEITKAVTNELAFATGQSDIESRTETHDIVQRLSNNATTRYDTPQDSTGWTKEHTYLNFTDTTHQEIESNEDGDKTFTFSRVKNGTNYLEAWWINGNGKQILHIDSVAHPAHLPNAPLDGYDTRDGYDGAADEPSDPHYDLDISVHASGKLEDARFNGSGLYVGATQEVELEENANPWDDVNARNAAKAVGWTLLDVLSFGVFDAIEQQKVEAWKDSGLDDTFVPLVVEGGLIVAREVALGVATAGVSTAATATRVGLMAKKGFLLVMAARGVYDGATSSTDAAADFRAGNYGSGVLNTLTAVGSFFDLGAAIKGLQGLKTLHVVAPRVHAVAEAKPTATLLDLGQEGRYADAPQGGALVPMGATPLGNWGEARLKNLLGDKGSKTNFSTSTGRREVDRLVDRVAHESKAGVNVKPTSSIRRQIAKDKELIDSGQVDGAHWHFWQGADQRLLNELTENGIDFTVH